MAAPKEEFSGLSPSEGPGGFPYPEVIEVLEARIAHLEGVIAQAVTEADHYADNPTDPEMIDKVSDLVEVLRSIDESRPFPRGEDAE